MDEQALRTFIIARVLSRISPIGERRNTALRDVLGLTAPHLDKETLESVAPLVPELPQALYEKWAGAFADKLLESVPLEQLRTLCDNTEDNNAALLLTYSMFMESERMEQTVAEDIKAL
ncbi:hypothetical protein LJC09_04730 [Desulfovibrio sp. OttesenSCG-928-F20]|nr:hypothetical protein [Desulfovibrio sp. OttesenSCG-928-F20]